MTEWRETEFGRIPITWALHPIKDLKANEKAAIAMGPFGSNIKAENFVPNGVPVIRGTNMNFAKYIGGEFVFLKEEKADELKGSNCKPGDLVFTHRGTIGQVGLIPMGQYSKYVISQSGMKLTVDSTRVNNEFLFYFFKSRYGQYQLLKNEGQVGVPSISNPLSTLKEIEVPVPSLLEQTVIAEVLSSLDDKIDLLHRQNKTLEQLAETLFRQWFVEEDSNKFTSITEFATNIKQSVQVQDLENYEHYVGLEHIPMRCITMTSWGSPLGLESAKSTFIKGDILFGKLRSYFHKVVFAPVDGVCSTDILVIRPKKQVWFAYCLFWLFNDNFVEFSDLGSGGTRMPRTSWEILSTFQIPRPNLELVIEFNKTVLPMLEKVQSNTTQIRTLEQLRDALLPKLMSGEVRVKI